jgi:hypothetical protein
MSKIIAWLFVATHLSRLLVADCGSLLRNPLSQLPTKPVVDFLALLDRDRKTLVFHPTENGVWMATKHHMHFLQGKHFAVVFRVHLIYSVIDGVGDL